MVSSRMNVRELQRPIRERYQRDPSEAKVVLTAKSATTDLSDPLHCAVNVGTTIHTGAHPAVGGQGDVPCSGDLLLAALAACQEVTLRMVAANMGIDLTSVTVEVDGDWDARGTLAFPGVPIGITNVRCRTSVTVANDERGERADRLLRSAEKYCVVLNTLRQGISVDSSFDLRVASAAVS